MDRPRALAMTLEFHSATDRGRIRSNNEDSIAIVEAAGLMVLADGMGGYNAGEVASGMATMLLSTELEAALTARSPHELDQESGLSYATRCVLDKVALTNAAIFQTAASQPQYAGMGTTLVMALFYDNRVTLAHLGDSRVYRLRGDELRAITRDHSLLQEQIDSGMISVEDARFSQNKNLVTRALGVDPEVETEIDEHVVQAGDIYLLCSDGLNDMVEDEEIRMTLQTLTANLELAAAQLIQMANDNGGRDNVSVILVRVLHEFPAARSWWSTLKARFK